ncbi:MAG: OadG family protein [Gammaproteobacteria bacterium]|nr:OadG family protein [Gammaproteobacteria bacterium]
MTSDLMAQGLELMLAGMGTVFVFLTALVGATLLMSRLVALMHKPVASDLDADAEEVAVITAAITEHRRRQRD